MKENKHKNRRILVIDDSEAIHEDFRIILGAVDADTINVDREEAAIFGTASSSSEQEGFEVDSAFQGQEGLEKIRQALRQGRPYAMAFVDVRMPPGWDGIETIQHIWKEYPELQVVVCTAYSDYSWHEVVKKLRKVDQLLILKKPFDNVEVYQLGYAMTEKWHLSRQAQLKEKELETRVKERTVELAAANEKLREHEQLKNEFVVNVSHELRTPLTIFKNIISNFRAGVMGRINSKRAESLEIAEKQIDRLARIIGDFLDISKIENGKMKLNPKRLAIQSLVTDVVKALKALAANKNVGMKTLMPDGELFINADYDRMTQVLTNLIDNAIKFSPDCGGRIMIRVKDLGDEIGVDVEDNGYGIQSDDISKVFNRFVQVGEHVGPGSHGTGLGLSISKELIELQGGRIWVENIPTGGANFCFVLPKADVREAVASAAVRGEGHFQN